MTISINQCRGARGMLGWAQSKLAATARVSRQTIVGFEGGARAPHPNNLAAIRHALESAGVEFLRDDGVRLTSSGG